MPDRNIVEQAMEDVMRYDDGNDKYLHRADLLAAFEKIKLHYEKRYDARNDKIMLPEIERQKECFDCKIELLTDFINSLK